MSPPRRAHRLDGGARAPDARRSRLTSTISRTSRRGAPRPSRCAARRRCSPTPSAGRARRPRRGRPVALGVAHVERHRPGALAQQVRGLARGVLVHVRDQHASPRPTSSRAISRPMPRPAPVTTAVSTRAKARSTVQHGRGAARACRSVIEPASSGRSPMAQTSSRRKKKPPARPCPASGRPAAPRRPRRKRRASQAAAARLPRARRAGAAGARRDRARPGRGAACCSGFMLWTGSEGGAVGEALVDGLRFLVGSVAYLVPLFVIGAGVALAARPHLDSPGAHAHRARSSWSARADARLRGRLARPRARTAGRRATCSTPTR